MASKKLWEAFRHKEDLSRDELASLKADNPSEYKSIMHSHKISSHLDEAKKALGPDDKGKDPKDEGAEGRSVLISHMKEELHLHPDTQEEKDAKIARVREHHGDKAAAAVERLTDVFNGSSVVGATKQHKSLTNAVKHGLGVPELDVDDKGNPIINVRVYKAEPTDKERKNMEDAKDTKKYMLQQLGGYQMTPEISSMVDAGIDSESIIRLMRKLTRRRIRMGHAIKRSSEIDMVRSMDEKAIAERHKR